MNLRKLRKWDGRESCIHSTNVYTHTYAIICQQLAYLCKTFFPKNFTSENVTDTWGNNEISIRSWEIHFSPKLCFLQKSLRLKSLYLPYKLFSVCVIINKYKCICNLIKTARHLTQTTINRRSSQQNIELIYHFHSRSIHITYRRPECRVTSDQMRAQINHYEWDRTCARRWHRARP